MYKIVLTCIRRKGKQTSLLSYQNVAYSRHELAEKLLNWHYATPTHTLAIYFSSVQVIIRISGNNPGVCIQGMAHIILIPSQPVFVLT
jgi:hypothetical protein